MMGRKCQEKRILAKMLVAAFRAGSKETVQKRPIFLEKSEFLKMKDAIQTRISDYRDFEIQNISKSQLPIREKIKDLEDLGERISREFKMTE